MILQTATVRLRCPYRKVPFVNDMVFHKSEPNECGDPWLFPFPLALSVSIRRRTWAACSIFGSDKHSARVGHLNVLVLGDGSLGPYELFLKLRMP